MAPNVGLSQGCCSILMTWPSASLRENNSRESKVEAPVSFQKSHDITPAAFCHLKQVTQNSGLYSRRGELGSTFTKGGLGKA